MNYIRGLMSREKSPGPAGRDKSPGPAGTDKSPGPAGRDKSPGPAVAKIITGNAAVEAAAPTPTQVTCFPKFGDPVGPARLNITYNEIKVTCIYQTCTFFFHSLVF